MHSDFAYNCALHIEVELLHKSSLAAIWRDEKGMQESSKSGAVRCSLSVCDGSGGRSLWARPSGSFATRLATEIQ